MATRQLLMAYAAPIWFAMVLYLGAIAWWLTRRRKVHRQQREMEQARRYWLNKRGGEADAGNL